MITTIDTVISKQSDHLESIQHGQPIRLSEAMATSDFFAQGDLNIGVVDKIPEGYVRVENPGESHLQLVKGNTAGARHCLDSLEGVELYHPENWTEESLLGPCFTTSKERTILHPTHGDVIVPAGMSIQVAYQVNYDEILKAEQRARD